MNDLLALVLYLWAWFYSGLPGDPDVVMLLKGLEDLQDRVVRVRTLTGIQLDSAVEGGMVYDYSYGTGVFISKNGMIATAQHLVRKRDNVSPARREVAVLLRGSRHYIPVDVVAEDPRADFAVLRVNPRTIPVLKQFQLAGLAPLPGRQSYVLGIRAEAAPESFEIGVIAGSFVDADRRITEIYQGDIEGRGPWVAVSQRILPGYSGGAILDDQGLLRGIVVGAPELRGKWTEFSMGIRADAIQQWLARTSTARSATSSSPHE